MICLAVTFVVKPGHEKEAIRLFAELTEETRAEPGCRMYLAHRSTDDPRRSTSSISPVTSRGPTRISTASSASRSASPTGSSPGNRAG